VDAEEREKGRARVEVFRDGKKGRWTLRSFVGKR